MSFDQADAGADAGQQAGADAVGQSLRRLREAQGWSTADVSGRLKFSARQIEALEGERWEELPKGLPLRGLIRNYARMLGTDPDALLGALEPRIGAVSAGREPLSTDSSSRALYQESEASSSRGSLGWIVVILIVLGVAVAYAFGQGWLPQEWLPAGWFSGSAS